MTKRRTWGELLHTYRLTLAYIAVVVTVGLILQVWTVARR